jgi:hypothetical protein
MAKKLDGEMPDWSEAACRDADIEIFDWDDTTQKTPSWEASRYCVRCELTSECLDWALKNEKFGVWGNTTPYQRRLILKEVIHIRCIGCGSFDILEDPGHEICLACGLSWLV